MGFLILDACMLCYNSSLITSTVVSFTTANFKLLILAKMQIGHFLNICLSVTGAPDMAFQQYNALILCKSRKKTNAEIYHFFKCVFHIQSVTF
jgi:hypothetical protein